MNHRLNIHWIHCIIISKRENQSNNAISSACQYGDVSYDSVYNAITWFLDVSYQDKTYTSQITIVL